MRGAQKGSKGVWGNPGDEYKYAEHIADSDEEKIIAKVKPKSPY
jgi:hypothetical protein